MFRFLYYKGYIEILDIEMLLELKKDVAKDYKSGNLEHHQYEYLTTEINKKLNNSKVVCI